MYLEEYNDVRSSSSKVQHQSMLINLREADKGVFKAERRIGGSAIIVPKTGKDRVVKCLTRSG